MPADARRRTRPTARRCTRHIARCATRSIRARRVAPFNEIMTAANNPAQIIAAAASRSVADGLHHDDAVGLATWPTSPPISERLQRRSGGRGGRRVLQRWRAITTSCRRRLRRSPISTAACIRDGCAPDSHSRPMRRRPRRASPVCRFYIPPALRRLALLFGVARRVRASHGDSIRLSSTRRRNVFYIGLARPGDGRMSRRGRRRVYRVWDNRPDTNHRYTTSTAVVEQMQAQGWIAEGYGPGPYYPIMCAAINAPADIRASP